MAVNCETVRIVEVDELISPVADPIIVTAVFVRTLPKSIDAVLELMPTIEAAKVPSIVVAADADVEITAAETAASAIIFNVINTPSARCGDRIRPPVFKLSIIEKKLNKFIPQNSDFCES